MSSVSSQQFAHKSSRIQKRRQCRQCSKSFSRDDHLKRHELNHQVPEYSCEQPGCGKRFHRQDVLQRHSTVHENESRGCQDESSLSDVVTLENRLAELDNMLVDSPSSWNDNDNSFSVDYGAIELGLNTELMTTYAFGDAGDFLPSLGGDSHVSLNENIHGGSFNESPAIDCPQDCNGISYSIINECILSFRQHCAPRLPFVHNSHFQHTLPQEIQTSIAALGALHDKKNKTHAQKLHGISMQLAETRIVGPSFLQLPVTSSLTEPA